METVTVFTTLAKRTCPDCGGVYAIAQEFIDEAYRRGSFKQCWACPYCQKTRGFGEGEIDKLNKQLTAANDTARFHRERAESKAKEAEHFRKSRDAVKGVVTKIKKRVGRGVCPCCNRTFQDLQRHMVSQHPKYYESQ